MHTSSLRLLLTAVTVASSTLLGQSTSFEFPKRTDEERWNRAALFADLNGVIPIALGKARGMSLEEIGDTLGKLYAPRWSATMTPQGRVLGGHRNFMTQPNAIMEIVAASGNEITTRANRPYLARFGDQGIWYGVTVQEAEKVWMMTGKAIAARASLEVEDKIEGPWWISTVRKPGLAATETAKFELPQRTKEERWKRAAYFADLNSVIPIAFGKARGMSIEEVGEALGKMYAPRWNAKMTPQSLVTGFHRNFTCHPDAIMEIVTAAESAITIRANRPYLPRFGEQGVWYGVTVPEAERVWMMVDKAIAARGGLEIEEKIEGPWWITTVRKKAGP